MRGGTSGRWVCSSIRWRPAACPSTVRPGTHCPPRSCIAHRSRCPSRCRTACGMRSRHVWSKIPQGAHSAPARSERCSRPRHRHYGRLPEDPVYAPAYSGLADSHFYLGYAFGRVPPREAMPIARHAASTALKLDTNLAEAHTSSGLISMMYDWNRPAAETSFQTALRLNPSTPRPTTPMRRCWRAGADARTKRSRSSARACRWIRSPCR